MPPVALISDMGTSGTSLSAVKLLLQQHLPGTDLVDISHHVPAYNIQQTAFLSMSSYLFFPSGTIQVLLVNVLDSERPRMLLAEKDGYYFIIPGNGIVSLLFGGQVDALWLCMEFPSGISFREWVAHAASVVTLVQRGGSLHEHFSPFAGAENQRLLPPKPISGGVECNILYIDRFGNVVINLNRDQFNGIIGDNAFRIQLTRKDSISKISRHYNDVSAGKPLCRFNSMGFMEICVNRDSAAARYELLPSGIRDISYQAITISYS